MLIRIRKRDIDDMDDMDIWELSREFRITLEKRFAYRAYRLSRRTVPTSAWTPLALLGLYLVVWRDKHGRPWSGECRRVGKLFRDIRSMVRRVGALAVKRAIEDGINR